MTQVQGWRHLQGNLKKQVGTQPQCEKLVRDACPRGLYPAQLLLIQNDGLRNQSDRISIKYEEREKAAEVLHKVWWKACP